MLFDLLLQAWIIFVLKIFIKEHQTQNNVPKSFRCLMSLSSPRIQVPRRAYTGPVLFTTVSTGSNIASNTGSAKFSEWRLLTKKARTWKLTGRLRTNFAQERDSPQSHWGNAREWAHLGLSESAAYSGASSQPFKRLDVLNVSRGRQHLDDWHLN